MVRDDRVLQAEKAAMQMHGLRGMGMMMIIIIIVKLCARQDPSSLCVLAHLILTTALIFQSSHT